MTPEALAAEWMELFNTNSSRVITNREFLDKYNELDKKYRDLSEGDKTKFTAIIHSGIRETLATKPWQDEEIK